MDLWLGVPAPGYRKRSAAPGCTRVFCLMSKGDTAYVNMLKTCVPEDSGI